MSETTLELNHPLTPEQWDKITDAEMEKTDSVTFTTPSGKRVEFVKRALVCPGWVPAADRTPEINPELREIDPVSEVYTDFSDPVLCLTPNGTYHLLSWAVEPERGWEGWLDEYWEPCACEWWMPLPPPPEVDR